MNESENACNFNELRPIAFIFIFLIRYSFSFTEECSVSYAVGLLLLVSKVSALYKVCIQYCCTQVNDKTWIRPAPIADASFYMNNNRLVHSIHWIAYNLQCFIFAVNTWKLARKIASYVVTYVRYIEPLSHSHSLTIRERVLLYPSLNNTTKAACRKKQFEMFR